MKKSIVLLFLVFVVFISCKTKVISKSNSFVENKEVNYIPYYLKVYEADSLFVLKDYEGSYRIFDSLFKKYKPINMPVLFEYNSYLATCVMTGHIENFDDKVRKAFLEFGSIGINSSDYQKLMDTILKTSKITNNEIKELKNKYYQNLNFELIAKIDTLVREDQSARGNFYSKEKIRFYLNKHINDINLIFEKYGYPSDKLVGTDLYFEENNIKRYSSFDILLVHQAEVYNIIQDLLTKILFYVKKGECDPSVYAKIYDKYIWNIQDKQYYGSIISDNIEKTLPLLNSKKIDSIRKSIGLNSYYYEDWRNKKNWGE